MISEIEPGRPGGLRIILLRFMMLLLLTVTTGLAARHAIADGPGRDPRIVAQELNLSLGMVRAAFAAAAPVYGGVAAVVGVGFLLFDQLLAASALLMLGRPRPSGFGGLNVWRTVWDDALRYLPRFLRLVVVVVVLTGLGGAALGKPFEKIAGLAIREGWLGTTTIAVTALGRGLLVLLWGFFLGALARWSRVLMVADDRRVVRSALRGAVRLAWRTPFRTAIYFVLIPLLLQLSGGLLLGLMFSRLQGPLEEQLMLLGGWAGYLLVVSTVWYLLIHRARVLLARDRFDDIRAAVL